MNADAAPRPSSSLPVLFVGHGSPMNAIEDTRYARAWRDLGASLPHPRAIVCVSAHWFVDGTFVTANDAPPTIHDFGGFPRALFEVTYPARGDGDLAKRILRLLDRYDAQPRTDWGLDHGTWSVLVHLRPAADVPVLQVSIDRRAAASTHLAIGRSLATLRNEGVLVLASGNVTHNLRHAMMAMSSGGDVPSPAWATGFDADVARAIEHRDHDFLAKALESEQGRLSHPWPDHYWPLLYAAAATTDADAVTFPVTGFDLGSLSMRSVRWG